MADAELALQRQGRIQVVGRDLEAGPGRAGALAVEHAQGRLRLRLRKRLGSECGLCHLAAA